MGSFKDHKAPTRVRWAPTAALAAAATLAVVFFMRSAAPLADDLPSPAQQQSANAQRALNPVSALEQQVPQVPPEEEWGADAGAEEAAVVEEVEEPSASPQPDSPLVETHTSCFQSAEYDEICTYDLLCFDGDKVRGCG